MVVLPRMEILWYITIAVGATWVLLFISSMARLRRTPSITPARKASHGPLPRVSVIIPARNEEANILPCLESLLAGDHSDIEIIVVDDDSSDATAALVARLARADYRVRLVRSEGPAEGWTGKCHALHLGVNRGRPSGEWLLFVDADTRHQPQSISAPLQVALDRNLDLVSLLPHLEGRSFWEKLMQPTVAAWISLLHRPERVNDPRRPEVFINGQYILVKKSTYLAAGGHAAVRGKVLEDYELARVLAAHGARMLLALGRDLLSVRMYTGLRPLLEGWAKNLYLLLSARVHRVLLASLVAFALSLWPALAGLAGLSALLAGWPALPAGKAAVLLGVYLLVLLFQVVLRAVNRWYPAYAPLAPLANLLVVVLFMRSMYLHATSRGVTWKGRVLTDK